MVWVGSSKDLGWTLLHALGSTGCRLMVDSLSWDDWFLPPVVSTSGRLAHVCSYDSWTGSEKEWELLCLLSYWHTIASAAFYWLKQVKRPAQIQGMGNRLDLLIGVSATSHCNGIAAGRWEKLEPQSISLTLIPEKLLLWMSSHHTNLPFVPDGCCNLLMPYHSSFLAEFRPWLSGIPFNTT